MPCEKVDILGPIRNSFCVPVRAKPLVVPGLASSGKSVVPQVCVCMVVRLQVAPGKRLHGKASCISVATSTPFRTPGEAFRGTPVLTQLLAHPELPVISRSPAWVFSYCPSSSAALQKFCDSSVPSLTGQMFWQWQRMRLLESSPENVKEIFIFNNSHACFFLILCLTNCFLFTASTF